MSGIGDLIALFNHPVTQAIFDTGRYAVQRHIIPALNRTSTPPTEEEVQDAASEYAMDDESYGDIVDPDIQQDGEYQDETETRAVDGEVERVPGDEPEPKGKGRRVGRK